MMRALDLSAGQTAARLYNVTLAGTWVTVSTGLESNPAITKTVAAFLPNKIDIVKVRG